MGLGFNSLRSFVAPSLYHTQTSGSARNDAPLPNDLELGLPVQTAPAVDKSVRPRPRPAAAATAEPQPRQRPSIHAPPLSVRTTATRDLKYQKLEISTRVHHQCGSLLNMHITLLACRSFQSSPQSEPRKLEGERCTNVAALFLRRWLTESCLFFWPPPVGHRCACHPLAPTKPLHECFLFYFLAIKFLHDHKNCRAPPLKLKCTRVYSVSDTTRCEPT